MFAEQIALLHARSLVAQGTVVVNASIVTALFWRISPHVPSLLWLAALCSVAIARAFTVRAYRSRSRAAGEARTWAGVFVAGAALNGLVWGASALIFSAPGWPAHEMFIAFVLGGMVAGAAASNASYAPAFVAFSLPALLPAVVRFAAEHDPIHVAMAFMLALFGVAVAAISRKGGRAIEDAIRLRFRNEGLVESLTSAQERLADLNAGLERRVAERTVELERLLRLRLASEARLARFRALLDEVGDAVFIARAHDLEVVDVNEGACKLLGAGPDALVGRGLGELGIVPSLNGPGARAVMDSISAGEARTYEDQRVDSGGLLRALELSVAVREIDQQLYLMVAARDLSVRKEMENRLIQADLLARIGSLAAGVAHEINNPLACILSNLHHLSSRIGERPALAPGDEAELVGVIRESIEAAGRARDIVRDLSWLSPREQRGPEPVDVSALLHSCINVAMSAIRPRATLLSVPGNVPPVLGDRARLAQVFLNLLVNAAEAIPEGDAAAQRISVSTSFDRADGMVRIDVADTGRGIPAAISSRIFDPFFTTKPFGRGTGLGLSICHGIVTALGGRISVRSREGEGSTFSVSLPSLPPET